MRTGNAARSELFQQLRGAIIDLSFPPGAMISENELATRLKVSRTPVREALLRLADEHFVKVIPRKGTFVTPLDLNLMHEAQFLRESIELASLNSLNFPLEAGTLAEIEANLAQQEVVAKSGNVKEFFVLDDEFHHLLMKLAGHDFSWRVISSAKSHLDRTRMLGFEAVTPPAQYFKQHRAIFDAVVSHDIPKAYALLQEHLREVFSDIDSVSKLLPELFIPVATQNGAENSEQVHVGNTSGSDGSPTSSLNNQSRFVAVSNGGAKSGSRDTSSGRDRDGKSNAPKPETHSKSGNKEDTVDTPNRLGQGGLLGHKEMLGTNGLTLSVIQELIRARSR